MVSLLVLTGPPGAGKTTVARVLADGAARSVLVEGDRFFGFLTRGAVAPWLPGSRDQNEVVTTAAAAAAGAFARGGYTTVYDGVLGPWFLPTFCAASGVDRFDYVILLPPVDVCVRRVAIREGHGFSDEPATRKMHAEFAGATVAGRHVLRDLPETTEEVASLVASRQSDGDLSYPTR